MHLAAQLLPVFSPVFHAIDPFIQVALRVQRFADLVPFQVEIVVAVVITLGVGWMRSIRHMADCIDDKTGDERAVGVGADDGFIHDLFGGQDDRFGRKGGLPFARR